VIKTRKIRYIAVGLTAILVLSLSWYLIDRFSYSKEIPFYSIKADNDTILTIGIIGDSWAAEKRLDSILHEDLLEKNLKNKIFSSGHPGAKSKFIYQNLFKNSEEEHSSRFIIENNPDYCIVIAGVNDAISQIGSHFYAYHMTQIIKTLLHFKIKPVIISLPEFGIEETIDELDVISKNRNLISAYFNNNGEIDNIRTYRRVFAEKLESENLKDSIILIDFDKVCSNYNICPELFANSSHLSMEGDVKLCQIITGEMIKKINIH
jgi:hypothetical protein